MPLRHQHCFMENISVNKPLPPFWPHWFNSQLRTLKEIPATWQKHIGVLIFSMLSHHTDDGTDCTPARLWITPNWGGIVFRWDLEQRPPEVPSNLIYFVIL